MKDGRDGCSSTSTVGKLEGKVGIVNEGAVTVSSGSASGMLVGILGIVKEGTVVVVSSSSSISGKKSGNLGIVNYSILLLASNCWFQILDPTFCLTSSSS